MIKTQNYLPSSGDKEELLDRRHKKLPFDSGERCTLPSPAAAESGADTRRDKNRAGAYFSYVTARF